MVELDNFTVILLGVVFDPKNKKILIGKRENDPHIAKLSWCFPGGRLNYSGEMDSTLKQKIKEKTGLDVKNLGSIFSKTYPEKKEFLAIYFLCEAVSEGEKVGGDFVELKWVKPEELENHFTTSFHPHLKEYILNLK
ncbi:MAG TPA: NUDIX domain-containing protein [Candidatus Pacearchaeota archaeon]|nr:NUDIX domain-containing protein [Candidatus Pacearchaeota archaeon]